MATAYILMGVKVGTIKEVVGGLRSLPGVRSAQGVTGPYDVVAIAEVADTVALGELLARVDAIPGVVKTVSCLGILG